MWYYDAGDESDFADAPSTCVDIVVLATGVVLYVDAGEEFPGSPAGRRLLASRRWATNEGCMDWANDR